MCEPATMMAVGVGLQVYSGYTQARSQRVAGEAQNAYYDYLAGQQEQQADLITKTADVQAGLIQDQAKEQGKQLKRSQAQLASAQIAAMAASGVDTSSVTAQDITTDTYQTQRLDELALRYNADIDTWGVVTDASYKDWSLRTEAEQSRYAGRMARYTGKVQQRNTLLNTAVSVVGSLAMGGFGGGGSTSTQGIRGWLSGYKNAPSTVSFGGNTFKTVNAGNYTAFKPS